MNISMTAQTDELIARFLLGELSEEERTEVEVRFLSDTEFFEQLLAAENSLVDDYLLGRLSDEQQKQVEPLFQASSKQKVDLQFTSDLIDLLRQVRVAPTEPALTPIGAVRPADTERLSNISATLLETGSFKTFAQRFAGPGLIALVLVCASLTALVFHFYSQKRRLEGERAEIERNKQEIAARLREETQGRAQLDQQLRTEQEKRAKTEDLIAQLQSREFPRVTSVVLVPTKVERGGHAKIVTLKVDTKRVQLQLELDEIRRYPKYSVSINTFEGLQVWRNDSINPRNIASGRLTLTLPSSRLKYEDYRIELSGLSDNATWVHVADYILKVRK